MPQMSRLMRQAYKEAPRRSSMRPAYRVERNAIASAIVHPTMTSEVTAPAVTLAFSFRVVGRSVSIISAGQCLALARSLAGARGRAASKPGEGWRRRAQRANRGRQEQAANCGLPRVGRYPGLRRPGAPSAGYEGAPEPALLHHASMCGHQHPSKSRACFRQGSRLPTANRAGAMIGRIGARHRLGPRGRIDRPRLRQALAGWAHPEFRHGRSNCRQANGSGSPNLDRRA
jgi:hypothetical protein